MEFGSTVFREIWCVVFEFSARDGEIPQPICLVAHELASGQTLRLWEDELYLLPSAPYAVDRGSLFVAYYASAELGCHLALNWRLPVMVLDLYVEFRNQTNGIRPPCGNGLVGALVYHGLDSIEGIEKDKMRELALRGGPWTQTEQAELLDYCESDVRSTSSLLKRMEPSIDVPRAVHRGRFMATAARIENVGVPIDTDTLALLRENWEGIQEELIRQIDADYGVYQGRTFKRDRFATWLIRKGIPWPRLESGNLALDDDTFREMALIHPEVALLRELRFCLSQMRLADLSVGSDGRNRCLLSAFSARTGRNQPSNSKFIFGPAVWQRGLIRPEPGFGLAYVDWSQQEFGIAAALSRDQNMGAAYRSGDPYLTFAKQAGAIPEHATKETHGPNGSSSRRVHWLSNMGWGLIPWHSGSEGRAPKPANCCGSIRRPTGHSGVGRMQP